MNYFEIKFRSELENEVLIAFLSGLEFESFVEEGEVLKAYVAENRWNREAFDGLIGEIRVLGNIDYESKLIEDRNWNAEWESGLQPVMIAGRIWIGAPFHTPPEDVDYQLNIEPKMSFGTAHHETTALMLEWMLEIDFSGKKVLDMGTGTGILAIFAEMTGAREIFAIDIDPWSYENILENIERNRAQNIVSRIGDLDEVPDEQYDIILANINRNILLKHIQGYTQRMRKGSIILFSGFYTQDIPVIESEATKHGLQTRNYHTKNNWVALLMEKQ